MVLPVYPYNHTFDAKIKKAFSSDDWKLTSENANFKIMNIKSWQK
jgi:hypothetical protein